MKDSFILWLSIFGISVILIVATVIVGARFDQLDAQVEESIRLHLEEHHNVNY